MSYKGAKAKHSPEWNEVGNGTIAHNRFPNMRLKLIGGK
jgi:hypothetical protein